MAQLSPTPEAGRPHPLAGRITIKEIHELGSAMNLAQRTIRSFARFVPKEIVRGVMDKSVSAELGGVREEVTVVFTDVRDFTTIAESADPDMLMRQCRGISPCLQRLSSPKAEQSTSLLATP